MTREELRAFGLELREQVRALERAAEDMAEARRAAGVAPSRVVLWACAGTLHAFYTGIEKALETIAASLNSLPPAGPSWHRRLVERMAVDVADVRPAVLSRATVAELDDFLAFRHRYRNLYLFDLRWEPIRDLLDRAPALWARVSGELLAFAEAMERIAAADQ
ncbi:MAG: hypothetical protein HY744_11395 [Deltaproteobacteria bacterium]|nr:hypothetical protein [Deltaproteobacteria bacterium]